MESVKQKTPMMLGRVNYRTSPVILVEVGVE